MKIEMGKEYQTRNGREVRIYAVDCGGTMPVHGAYFDEENHEWNFRAWNKSGKYYTESENCIDLIEKPEVIEGWINVYRTSFGENVGSLHESKESALSAGTESQKLGCIPIKFTKGEGL